MCHDLRAPVRGLRTLPQWVRDEVMATSGDMSDGLAEVLDMMSVQAERLDRMLHDLSRYAKLARREAAPLTQVADALPPDDTLHHLDVEIEAAGIPMEHDHLELVLQALTSNALKHGAAKTHGAQLSVTAQGPSVRINLRDHGPGFDPKFQDAVFEPLRLLQSRDVCEGSGMGLAFVARIAEFYGATCEIDPAMRGGGLEARFTLPIGA